MDIVITLIQFLGVLVVVVLVHEFGHFASAKAFGIRVNEFGFGFPPRLLGIRKGETVYTVNLIPLGGFVKLEGEQSGVSNDPRSFAFQPPGVRLVVLVAGVVMNVVLGIVLLSVFFMFAVSEFRVGQVEPGSPAEAAGLIDGDRIVEMNGEPLQDFQDFSERINANKGQRIEWTVLRDGKKMAVRLTPRENPPEGQGPAGISRVSVIGSQRLEFTRDPLDAVGLGFQRTVQFPGAVKDAIVDWASDDGPVPFAGPVGIAQGTGEVAREFGLFYLIPLAAGLSLALAISNILPIPPLDGGHILFVIIEWARKGKKIPPEKQGLVHMAGLALLIGMVVAVSYNDLQRLIDGASILQ